MDSLLFMGDVFGANRVAAYEIVQDLRMWDPERKEEVIQHMAKREASLVDHAVIGDYDLALWHYSKSGVYAASINSGRENPATILGQLRRSKPQQLNRGLVACQLQKWVESYGRILIGAAQPDRTDQYRRLLVRHFLIGEWSEYPNAGFFILPD